MASYSIRKMGTRRGQPHYGADCLVCSPTPGGRGRILAVAHLSRDGAKALVEQHMSDVHGKAGA